MTCYLDNAATTKPCREAVVEITRMLTEEYGNPSSVHRMGMRAERELKKARKTVAAALGCEAESVYFTSGGTESDNWAIFSAAQAMGRKGRHIITTQVEHHAVLNPVRELERQGFEVTYLAPQRDGTVSVKALSDALRPDTVLVSVMLANNESGAVMPVMDMVRAVRAAKCPALFHTDAVQALFKMPLDVKLLGVDLLSVSGHKIHGPKGIGALYIRKGLRLKPMFYGGGQEGGLRSGTEPMPQIAGFAAACTAAQKSLLKDIAQMKELRDYAVLNIRKALPEAVLPGAMQSPHIIPLALPGIRSQGIINCLQDRDVYVSSGSACSRGKRSHVLEAMGLSASELDGAVRISLSRFTEKEELDAMIKALVAAKAQMSGS